MSNDLSWKIKGEKKNSNLLFANVNTGSKQTNLLVVYCIESAQKAA